MYKLFPELFFNTMFVPHLQTEIYPVLLCDNVNVRVNM